MAAASAVRRLSTLPPGGKKRRKSLQISDGEKYWDHLAANKAGGGRITGSCPKCWVKLEACVCDGMAEAMQSPVDVVVYVHHGEWGRSTNSATVLDATIVNCRMLLKGVDDAELGDLLERRECVVLWPCDEENRNSISPRECAGRTLVVPEGSWRTAKRVVNSLPEHIPRLSLPLDAVKNEIRRGIFPQTDGSSSMLAPLRLPSEDRHKARVCTCQAVVSALRTMGHSDSHCDQILQSLYHKVTVLVALRGGR